MASDAQIKFYACAARKRECLQTKMTFPSILSRLLQPRRCLHPFFQPFACLPPFSSVDENIFGPDQRIYKQIMAVRGGPRSFPLFENRRTGAGVKFAELGNKRAKKEMPYSQFSVRM
jgi:hypothetical protein